MLLTEEEAKKRWYPFARVSVTDSGLIANNRCEVIKPDAADDRLVGSNCIASECMAWRKCESAQFRAKADAEFRKSGMRLESTEGFCGLASLPQS